ncbi:MAG: winged helix-turn-helix domain-containing protein [Pseudomonadota bacterium]
MTLGISDEEFESAIDDAAKTRRIDLARTPDFAVGPLAVAPSLRTLEGDGGSKVIEPKVMQVLIALGEASGAILSRDDLIERCWEGRVVGESSINRVISLLRSALKEVVGDDVRLENVPKVGYRLLVSPEWSPPNEPANEPATAPASAPASEASPERAQAASDTADTLSQRPGRLVLACGIVALILAITSAFALWPSAPSAPVAPIRVAMLPLKPGEGVDPFYARGLEAELRTQLARVGRMEVTSSESARQLSEQGLSADEICRRLGADYAWVGSLKVGAEQVTLSAKLIDASTKEATFRETLSSAPGAAKSLPLRTARAITAALGRPVSDRLPETPVTAGDFQLYLTALGLIKTRGDDQRRAALAILEQVTTRNPQFADGWAGLAKAWFLLPERDKSAIMANRERAGEIARKALSLDPEAVDAIKVLGMLEATPPEERLALMKRATQLDPGDSEAWFWRGITQSQFVLLAEDPVLSARKMVKIDPLWPASWRSSELAAKFGDMETALAIEEAISAAAVTPSQQFLSQARLAQLQGDFSGFVEFSRQAQSTETPAERRYGWQLQLRMINFMLDLPPQAIDFLPSDMRGPLVEALVAGELPSKAEFAANGAGAEDFWSNPVVVELSMPLFLRDGREDELVAYYDAAFSDHAAFVAFLSEDGAAHDAIPSVSPYLAVALDRLGREAEADAHIAGVEEQVERWRASRSGSFLAVIYELNLAVLTGDNPSAIAQVEKLESFGWPYTMGHVRPSTVGLLKEDPLYDPLREEPRVQAVLDPIRANLAKERAEVLALGG